MISPRRLANPPGPGISGRRATARGYGRAVCCATREVAGGARRAVVWTHPSLRRWLFCALASVVAACGGDSATAPSPPLPNQAPVATGTIPAQTVVIGETGTVNVSGYFNDPGGDALTYSASSSDASVATVTVSGSTLTVTPVTQGMATVTVTARDPGGLSAQQSFTVTVPNRAPEVLITVTPDTITTDEAIEFSPPVSEWFIDPDGDPLTYTASSSDTAVALANLTDGELTVWSVAAGTTTITVMATDPGELSAELSFQVTVTTAGQSPVIITSVEPEVLVEGEAATITGTGFSPAGPDNDVSIGGLAATVTSASETSLSIMVPGADCLPPRRAELRVAIAASSDVRTVGVTPVIPEEPVRVTDAGDGCLHLPGSGAGGEYLIGVVSISEDVSSLTPVTLNGTPGDATVVGAARYAAAPEVPAAMLEAAASLASRPVQPRTAAQVQTRLPASAGRDSIRARHARAHLEMRERDRALWRELGPAIPPALDGAKAIRRREAAVGDTWDFHMNAMSCTEFETISAVVRLVSNDLVWLDDLDNPSETFSDAHLEFLDGLYTSYVKGVLADYFGDLSDVDGNGQVLILMTKEVNRAQSGLLGFVTGRDLRSQSQCAASNEAEIFYGLVPDPAGSFGQVRTAEAVSNEYPELLAHEIAHLVQNNYEVLGEAGPDFVFWEAEGSATLAEQLVGNRFFGHGSGQNLGWAEWLESEYELFYDTWLNDMLGFFGGLGDTRIAGAPEQCSWVAKGDTGPCLYRTGAVYGVPSMLLRYAMDRWGDVYPGGEQALMQRFIQSPPPHEGFASLIDVSPSWSIEHILADFYMSLGMELLKDIDTPGMSSWDLYDIFDQLPSHHNRLQPYMSESSSPQIEASIRAGSSLYFDWTPDGSLSPTSIKVTSPNGSPIPGHISVWAVRIR